MNICLCFYWARNSLWQFQGFISPLHHQGPLPLILTTCSGTREQLRNSVLCSLCLSSAQHHKGYWVCSQLNDCFLNQPYFVFFFFFSELEGALEIIFPQCIRGMEASDQGKVLYLQPYLLSGRGQRVQRKDQNQLWKLQLPQKVHSSKYFFLRGSTRSSGICPGRLRVHYCPDLCQTCASISLLVNQE